MNGKQILTSSLKLVSSETEHLKSNSQIGDLSE